MAPRYRDDDPPDDGSWQEDFCPACRGPYTEATLPVAERLGGPCSEACQERLAIEAAEQAAGEAAYEREMAALVVANPDAFDAATQEAAKIAAGAPIRRVLPAEPIQLQEARKAYKIAWSVTRMQAEKWKRFMDAKRALIRERLANDWEHPDARRWTAKSDRIWEQVQRLQHVYESAFARFAQLQSDYLDITPDDSDALHEAMIPWLLDRLDDKDEPRPAPDCPWWYEGWQRGTARATLKAQGFDV